MSCTIATNGKYLEVCHDAETVFYRFGPANRPAELALSVPITEVDYVPWPGVGRSIAEGIDFRNGNHVYKVYAGFDRMYDDEPEDLERSFGGVRIARDDLPLGEMICDPPTVDFGWSPPLWDAMIAAGLEWNDREQTWRPAR
ncbi:hypothetical protein [Jannaschia pohangensis]|nr:hypothetical protein [Jannaschia pohangensis]